MKHSEDVDFHVHLLKCSFDEDLYKMILVILKEERALVVAPRIIL